MSGEHGANHKFINAVRKGDFKELEELINSYGLPDMPNWPKGYILLRFAVESKRKEITELLLQSGSKVNNEHGQPSATPLHFAVKNNDAETVEILVKKGAEINAEDANGVTPIYLAVENEREDIVEYLLNFGARVNCHESFYRRADREPLLHIATKKGNERIVELLMRNGARVSVTDRSGFAPFHIAVEFRREEIFRRFLASEPSLVDIEYYSTDGKKKGYTLLHFAAETGDESMINLLLTKGLTVNVKTGGDNLTALHIAIQREHLAAVKFLLEHGADVDAKTKDNQTPLKLAVKIGCSLTVESILNCRPDSNEDSNRSALRSAIFECGNEIEKIIDCLLNYGFSVESEDLYDPSMLFTAVENGHDKIVEILLKRGADANHSGTDTRRKRSLLCVAASEGNETIAGLLLNYGADVNARDEDDNSPMFYAIRNGDLKTVKLLLDNGAEVEHSFEPLRLAVRNKHAGIVDVLLKYNAEINGSDERGTNALHQTLSIDDKDEILMLILNKGGIGIDARDRNGKTPLHIAVENKRTATVNLILKFNADVDSPASDDNATPLHLAASNGTGPITTALLSQGADLNARDKNGATPLHVATINGHGEVVDILLNWGAEYDFRSNRDANLLHIATENGFRYGVEILLEHGAEIDSTDDEGQTALHVAAKYGRANIVSFILDYGSDINVTNGENRTALDLAIVGKWSYESQLISKPYDKSNADSYREIIKFLFHHVAKLKCADLYVSKRNLDAVVVDSEFRHLLVRCEDEIEAMKRTNVAGDLSFYDILTTRNERQLEFYSRNEGIVQVLSSKDYKSSFPTYGGMIDSRFRRGVKRNRLLERSTTFFHHLPNSLPTLPRLCTDKILAYLSNRDLTFVIIAYSETITDTRGSNESIDA